MTTREFGNLLSDLLTAYIASHPGDSKNKMILRTGIDRSTFFKYLRGTRPITIGHLRAILDKIGLGEDDQKELTRAYEELNQNVAEYYNIEILRQCMKAVRKAEMRLASRSCHGGAARPGTSSEAAPDLTAAVAAPDPAANPAADSGTAAEASSSDKSPALPPPGPLAGKNETLFAFLSAIHYFAGRQETIYTFLPPDAAEVLWENRDSINPEILKAEMLFHFPAKAGDDVKARASRFYGLIPIALTINCSVHFYYGSDSLDRQDMLGVLYPYYVAGESGVFFMNASMDAAYFTSDQVTVRAYLEGFRNIFAQTESASDHISTIRESQQLIAGMLSEDMGSRRVFIIDRAPCMNLIATRELIGEVIPPAYQEAIWQYSQALQHAGPIEIIPEEGLRRMVEESGIEEAGIRITQPREVVHQILTGLKARLGSTLFLADKTLPLAEKWSFLVKPDQAVVFLPCDQDGNALILYEKNIVNGFSAALELSLDKITIETSRAEKLMDYYIGLTE